MKRLPRPLVRLAAGLLAGVALHAADRPNVLFIAVDDLRNWMGCYGDPQARTPHLDRLAARGVTFTRAYCGAPLCNPTRTSLVTGMRPAVTGVYGNTVDWRRALPEVMTLPLWFKEHGYYVAGAGKITHGVMVRPSDWHDFGPVNDRNEGGEDAGNEMVGNAPKRGDTVVGKFAWHIVPNAQESALVDYRITSYVIERLQKKHDTPFFLACGIHRPHTPWNVPQKYFDLFPLDRIQRPPSKADDLADVPPVGQRWAHPELHEAITQVPQGPERIIQAYRAAVAFCDAQVGRLLDALDGSPNRENTIVVLWGDHGWHHGEKLHWAKAVLWEEASRAPLLWVVPGVTAPGSRCARTVDFLSLFPTLCDLSGLPTPPQCKNPTLRPLLANPAAPWDRPALTTFQQGNHAVRTERWRYIRYADGTEELYDHEVDPQEWTNLAARPEHAALKQELARWLPASDAPDKARSADPGVSQAGKKRRAAAK